MDNPEEEAAFSVADQCLEMPNARVGNVAVEMDFVDLVQLSAEDGDSRSSHWKKAGHSVLVL